MLIMSLAFLMVGCNNDEPQPNEENNNGTNQENTDLDIVSTDKVVNFYGTTYEVVFRDGRRMYFNLTNNTEVSMCGYDLYYGTDDYLSEYEYKGDLIVPASITLENKQYKVSEISSLRPYNLETDNTFLTSVQIPASVHNLYASFHDCSALKNVVMQEGITSIDGAFKRCKSITNIKIPNSVTELYSAFEDCVNLINVNIPSGVTELGDNCFQGCVKLSDFEQDELDNIRKIGFQTFKGCANLTYIKLLSIEEIDWDAFSGCSNLKTIILGRNCSKIGGNSFEDCNSITDVYCYATTPPSISFSGLDDGNFTLHVPADAIEQYKESSWGSYGGWSDIERTIVPIE